MSHFSPYVAEPRPCWHCQHFEALVYRGTAALCSQGASRMVRATPAQGCAFWTREPGADDEAGPPILVSQAAPLAPWAPLTRTDGHDDRP